MRIVGNNPQLSRQTQGTASGAITGGKPVVVNTNGTVSEISASDGAVGTAVVFESATTTLVRSTFDSNSNRVVVFYRDDGNSNYGTVVVGTVDSSDNSISFGTPVVAVSDAIASSEDTTSITFDSNSNKVVISYTNGSTYVGHSKVGTVDSSDNSISFGSEATFESGNTTYIGSTFDTNSNKVVIVFRDVSDSNKGKGIVGTVSGTSISFGTAAEFNAGISLRHSVTFDNSNNKVVVAYRDQGNSNYGTAAVGTVSGTSISFGSEVVFEAAATNYIATAFDSNNNKVVITYQDQGNSNYGTAIVGTVSGTSISFGTAVVHRSADINNQTADFDTNKNAVILAYTDTGNSNKIMISEGRVSDTSISFSTAVAGSSGQTTSTRGVSFDSNVNRTVVSYVHEGSSEHGTSIVYATGTPTNITSENFIGFAQDTVATGQPVTINTKGAIADNILPQLAAGSAGTKVVIDDDDTMSFISTAFDSNSNKVVIAYQDGDNSNYGTAVVGTVTASDKSISFGTPVVFESATTGYTNIVFDSNSNKMVITYRDAGNSNQGTAIVGTVSGTSISFGSAAVFETGETINMSSTFDSSNNKVVIAFEDEDDSGKGKAIVGTVSGTSISFGTAAVFNDADTGFTSTAFDTTNNKVVIAFADKGNSNRGTAIVGTVSGTDISFGSEAIFNSGTTAEIHHSISFNPVAGKMLIAYIDTDDSEKGKAIVGTVSGTSISFGTASEYNSRPELSETVYDSERDLIVIAYGDNNNSRRATAIGATISGTSVSFSAELAFDSSTGNKNDIHLAYDSSANRVVAAYKDSGNNNGLNSTVFTTAGNGPITPAQTYYVQTDGTLSQTADSPSVTAGTAVAGSTLIVKG